MYGNDNILLESSLGLVSLLPMILQRSRIKLTIFHFPVDAGHEQAMPDLFLFTMMRFLSLTNVNESTLSWT